MYCKYCGNKLEDGEKFCSHCGKSIREEKVNNKKHKIIIIVTLVIIAIIVIGIIAIPKLIKYSEEQQYQQETQQDLDNISIQLKINELVLPYQNAYNQSLFENEYDIDLNNLDDYTQFEKFVEAYNGGTLNITGNIDINKIGEYEIDYIVTSEKGNSKTEKINVKVQDFMKPALEVGETTIIIEKGDTIDIMEGVSAEDNVDGKEELQSKITTEGEVDTNKVGEYKITYKVTDSAGLNASATRTYKVEEKSELLIGVPYTYRIYNVNYNNGYADSTVTFNSKNSISYTEIRGMDKIDYDGTYTITGNVITANVEYHSEYLGDESATLKLIILDENTIKDNNTGYIYKTK